MCNALQVRTVHLDHTKVYEKRRERENLTKKRKRWKNSTRLTVKLESRKRSFWRENNSIIFVLYRLTNFFFSLQLAAFQSSVESATKRESGTRGKENAKIKKILINKLERSLLCAKLIKEIPVLFFIFLKIRFACCPAITLSSNLILNCCWE